MPFNYLKYNYNPETGQYIDAAPISTAIDNALKTRSLDRNGLMCNNTIELAGNPYTIEPATGLSSDPTYNPTDKLPNWLKRRIERQKRLQEIYNRIPWYAKVIVGTVLLAASIALTLVSRTGGAGVASIFIQLALGIGIGVGTYLASSLLTNTFTPEGLLNTVLDTFVITSAVIFISVGINYVKYLSRSSKYSPEFLEWLNKGESNNTVYKGLNKYGEEMYTGITRQPLESRLKQHIRAGKDFNRLEISFTNLTRNQARSIETYKILTDGTSQVNKILSVSRKHRFFNEAMLWAKTFIGG